MILLSIRDPYGKVNSVSSRDSYLLVETSRGIYRSLGIKTYMAMTTNKDVINLYIVASAFFSLERMCR